MSNTQSKSRLTSAALALGSVAIALAYASRRRQSRSAGSLSEILPRGQALITGASSGIGEVYARRLAAAGFDLILVARREERLQDLAEELTNAHPISAAVLVADLAVDDDISRVAEHIEYATDLVLLINNAGFGTRGNFIEADVNRQGGYDPGPRSGCCGVLARAALPGLVERGAGAVINVSSVSAFFPSPGGATYSASKVFLNNFSEALQSELTGTEVRVQALCPGFFYSEFHDTPDYEGFTRDQIPDVLWMTAEQVVDESLAALAGNKVIVVPGRQYRAIVKAAQSPVGGSIRRLARDIRRRME
jgi:uncharacterized protein